MKVLILAGGGGTRLWPLSRQEFPKQFLCFEKPYSLLQSTVKRFLGAAKVEKIVIATNKHYQSLVKRQLAAIDPAGSVDILVEPERKNTAAAIALGVRYFEEQDGRREDSTILVIPSDHLIEPEAAFLRYLEEAELFAKQQWIVLFGIRPTRAETGYGYIHVGGQEEGLFYHVKRFVEKPNSEKAEQYLSSGEYYWNAGMFAFTARQFWEEAKLHAPAIYGMHAKPFSECLSLFPKLPNVSIDYALLEKTRRIVVCPMSLHWSDVGSWDSVYEALGKDSNQNVLIGNVVEMDSKNNLIFGGKKLISAIGLEDIIMVDTEEALFVVKKGHSQKVKEMVERLSSLSKPGEQKVKPLYQNGTCRVLLICVTEPIKHRCKKPERWVCLKGEAKMVWKGHSKTLQAGEAVSLASGASLHLSALQEGSELLCIEYEKE